MARSTRKQAVEPSQAPAGVTQVVTVEAPVPVAERALLVNLTDRAVNVPLRDGTVRVGPKASEAVLRQDVTEETRQEGRIVIRNP